MESAPTNPLLNLKQLAKAMGVGYFFTKAMRAAGMPTPGRKVTETCARQWLAQNPEFVPSRWLGVEKQKAEELRVAMSGDRQP